MSSINVNKFYGYKEESLSNHQKKEDKKDLNRTKLSIKVSRKMPSHIMGPTQFWKECNKQCDALALAAEKSTPNEMLCTFVYQNHNGFRIFVVAHPEVYWWYYKDRPPEEKCSYEVIPESLPCRLYLDLEYYTELNPQCNGSRMTNTLIEIFCSYLLLHWGLPCNKYNILNLDSSNDIKFSRHLIFNIKDVAFKDNFHIGRFVKSVYQDIFNYIISKQEIHPILNAFDRKDVEELLIESGKAKKLFIDTGVYTKNRHFRIYKSTKWSKKSHLIVSPDCKYIPYDKNVDKELNIFLNSLVSYFPCTNDMLLLEFSEEQTVNILHYSETVKRFALPNDNTRESMYPLLDTYVQDLIKPGKIRACKYFECPKILIYETVGYRYCENIGRCHKSNNVFWIVDLNKKVIYQKCHDEDCAGFKSQPKKLSEEICFQIDEETDILLTSVSITEDLVQCTDLSI